MANSLVAVDSNVGGKPTAPINIITLDFALTDYATGGVDIAALLDASAIWKALKLPSSGIVAGVAALDPDAEGLLRVAEFLPVAKLLVLKKASAGPVLAEEGNGAIGATVNLKLTLWLA